MTNVSGSSGRGGPEQLEDLREALEAVHVGVWSRDVAEGALRWSDELCVLFGREPGNQPSSYDEYLSLIVPEDREGVRAVIEGAMRQASDARAPAGYVVEHRVQLADGQVRWLEGRGRVLVNADGRVTRLTGTTMDVTVRKETEERLRKSEALHRLMSEVASDYVYLVDLQQPTLFPEIVGGSFERTTGLTASGVEALGGWMQVILAEDRPAMEAVVPQIVSGRPSVVEYRIKDSDGRVRWLRDSIRPLMDPTTGACTKLMGGVQDISERKRLEDQLRQAEKLGAIARLSGGVAHDFNNLLAIVMGAVEELAEQVDTDRAREACAAILEASQRGAELTRSLLVFARRDASTPRVVNLGDVVRAAVPMLTRAVGPMIVVRIDEGSDVGCHVRIDAGQAQLLLLNLAVNARDAMPSGGTIRLALGRAGGAGQSPLPAELAPGSYARLSVADDGEGIPPHVLPSVFEPFFTTKAHGRGTGLGLATCHGIVLHASGAIEVSSEVGRGTKFSIYLPLVAGVAPAVAAPGLARLSVGGSERVLLVEDEERLRNLLGRALRDRGYDVAVLASAEEALVVLEQQSFDLLLSDIVLPGMHGGALVRVVRERWPRMALSLMSGYSGSADIPADMPLLSKPFTLDRLASHVRQVLDGVSVREV